MLLHPLLQGRLPGLSELQSSYQGWLQLSHSSRVLQLGSPPLVLRLRAQA